MKNYFLDVDIVWGALLLAISVHILSFFSLQGNQKGVLSHQGPNQYKKCLEDPLFKKNATWKKRPLRAIWHTVKEVKEGQHLTQGAFKAHFKVKTWSNAYMLYLTKCLSQKKNKWQLGVVLTFKEELWPSLRSAPPLVEYQRDWQMAYKT